MNNIKETSLTRALMEYNLTSLPDADDGKEIWVRAIAEVEKKDMSHSYVYVEKDPDSLENVVKADFGKMIQINKILSYHPFCFLNAAFIPVFKSKNKDERIAYLKHQSESDFSKMTLKQLDLEILKLAIKKQLSIEKSSEHAKRKS